MSKKALFMTCFAFIAATCTYANQEIDNGGGCVPVNLSCGHSIICGDSFEEVVYNAWEAEQVFCGD